MKIMRSERQALRLKVVNAFLIIAFIYLALFVPIFFIVSDSLFLQLVHLIDLIVCVWAVIYIRKTKDITYPSVALCIIAYTTVVAVTVTGGFLESGPFLVFPYVPFVAFLSGNRRIAYSWLGVMFITLWVILILGIIDEITIPLEPGSFALYVFMYLLTILLIAAYIHEKELADDELQRNSFELKQKNKKLKHLNVAKDNFIFIASHQLRTPATGVKQYIGMLLEGYSGTMAKKQRSYAQKAYDSNERQIKIVNDLLLVAQVDTGKVQLKKVPVDIIRLVQDVIMDNRSVFASRKQTIQQNFPNPSPTVIVDYITMRMVLENLFDNASKYTPNGKKINVSIESQPESVSVVIKDEGVGISRKDRAKLFKKFSRLDNPLSIKVGGSGLGLYWAKKIVDLHKGKLLVSSKLDQGSTFTLVIPKK